jgi:hypothetical protein
MALNVLVPNLSRGGRGRACLLAATKRSALSRTAPLFEAPAGPALSLSLLVIYCKFLPKDPKIVIMW